MLDRLNRRDVLCTAPAAGLALLGLSTVARAQTPAATSAPWPGFPHQDPTLVRTVVGAAHRDEAKVRSLIDAHPALVNAAWDWGFGDWETPLGAASHTGRRAIAELLISRGARVDIFAAAMLGWTDAVKAMTAASPGVQRAAGPHGFTLLHHARVGGDESKAVLDQLTALGDADTGPTVIPLDVNGREVYHGTYRFGPGPKDAFRIAANRNGIEFAYLDESSRPLLQAKPDEFFPSGVPSVRFRFTRAADSAISAVTITDHDLIVTAERGR